MQLSNILFRLLMLMAIVWSGTAEASEIRQPFESPMMTVSARTTIDHLSWCEDGKVMMSAKDRRSSKAVADCDAVGKVCKSGQVVKRDRLTFFAYCE